MILFHFGIKYGKEISFLFLISKNYIDSGFFLYYYFRTIGYSIICNVFPAKDSFSK